MTPTPAAAEGESEIRGGASLSADGIYRWTLRRWWANGPTATFVMLNPSTADATQDDPTIRRCIGFAKRMGCGSLLVVNLFARRATNPRDLIPFAGETVEREELAAWGEALAEGGPLIAAWGASPNWLRRDIDARSAMFRANAQMAGRGMHALGLTQDGSPRHPLYLKGDAQLVAWPTEGTVAP